MKNGYYQLIFDQEEEVIQCIISLISHGVKRILLLETPENYSAQFIDELNQLSFRGLELITKDTASLLKNFIPYGVLTANDFEKINQMKTDFPNCKIVVTAHSLVDCKNAELAGADLLFVNYHKFKLKPFEPRGLMGQEAMEAAFPSKEQYGWVFLTVNTPVVVGGMKSIHEVKQLMKHTDLESVIITDDFEVKMSLEEKITALFTVLN